MKKTKRLLSFLTAVAISASVFAGMVIPASAEKTPIGSTYTFEGGAADVWAESGSHTVQYETDIVNDTTLKSNVLHTALNNQTGGRNMTLTIPSAITPAAEDVVELTFDWYSKTTGANCSTDTILAGTDGKQIFKLSDVVASSKAQFNGVDIGSIVWYKVAAVLDFETKQVVTVSFTPNGADTPVKTIYNTPFIDTTASDVTGIFMQANRKNNISLDWRMDNFAASTVTGEHYKATLAVKTKGGEAVADADVTIGEGKYKTDANGQVVTKLPVGEYDYTVKKSGYEATEGQEDDATGKITITDADVTENVVYSQQVYTPVPNTVTLSGGQKAMTAPHTADTLTSAAYEVTVIDQKNVAITDADIEWTVVPAGSEEADANVTISNGVVTVAKGFNAGETHVKDFTVTAKATKNGESKTATSVVKISDYLFYEPGVGGSSYGTTNVGTVGSDTYIATPSVRNVPETITLPDPIVFTKGTAQLLSFKIAANNATGYTFKRTITPVDEDGNAIVNFGFINLDIGDADTATWATNDSTKFATTWGSMTGVNTWLDVSLLFKTNANEETKVVLTVGDKKYDLGVTEAKGLAKINTLMDMINSIDRYIFMKDIVVSEVDVTGMEIDGPDKFSSVAGQTVTKNYAIDAMVIEDGEEFEWSTDIAGATITADENNSQKAVLSVPGTVVEGGKVTAKSKEGTATKPKNASLDLTIEPAEIKSATVKGSATLDKSAGKADYTVSDVTDQFGDDVTDYFTPAWSVETASQSGKATFTVNAEEAGTAVAIKAEYKEDNTLKNVTTEDVTLTAGENTIEIEASAGAKVMLWDKLNGMKPIAGVQTAEGSDGANAEINAQTGELSITDNGDVEVIATFTHGDKTYPFSKDVKIATFSIVKEATENSTTVDISELVTDASIRGYRVTTATAEKTLVKTGDIIVGGEAAEGAVATLDGTTLTVDTTGAAKVEVAPLFVGSMNKEYLIPGDTYNVTVTANDGARTDVFANDQLIFNNINQGSDNWTVARAIPKSADYTASDVVISQGSVKFTYADDKSSGTTISQVKFAKAPSIVNRAKRVYVIGDSLTAKYYGVAPEGQETLVRTGWGDVLGDYLADGVEITNLGNSGAWAEGMLNDAFTNVRESGQEGDILVLESGYNDSSHTSMEVMRESVKAMVRGAEEKGMTVFVVTPNASSHSGNEYLGSVKSTGDMIRAYNELVEEGSKAVLIDLAAKSGFFFKSYYGDAAYAGDTPSVPEATGTILKTYYNNSGDSLHSSYNAANCWAAVVANGIYENADTKALIDATHEYTFSDGTNNIVVSATKISNPNYVDYEITFAADGVTVTRPNGTAITKAAAGDTVKVVVTDNTDPVKVVKANSTEAVYNTSTKAYYFTMPAEAVTITVEAAATNPDTTE